MKKNLLVLIALTVAALPSYSAFTAEDATSQQYIKGHGHSTEMSRLIDLQNSQINNEPTKFVAPTKPTRMYEKIKWSKIPSRDEKTKSVLRHLDPANEQGKVVKTIYNYLDPSQDDGKFMQNNTEYTTNYEDL